MKRTILILLSVFILLGLIIVSSVLFQEGNPIPILKGIVELSSSDDKIIQISETPQRYLSKTNVGNAPLIELMDKEGWKFVEQLGAGYIFSKDGDRLIITGVQYSGEYIVWKR
ncbi:MAG TPA: hypothetical protein VFC84_01895 [Desulfosporosinus sp.]|nr:hypothetical protein [Desulfosporosinus sp.]